MIEYIKKSEVIDALYEHWGDSQRIEEAIEEIKTLKVTYCGQCEWLRWKPSYCDSCSGAIIENEGGLVYGNTIF